MKRFDFYIEPKLKEMSGMFEIDSYLDSNINMEKKVVFQILSKMSLVLKSSYVPTCYFNEETCNGKKLIIVKKILDSLLQVS